MYRVGIRPLLFSFYLMPFTFHLRFYFPADVKKPDSGVGRDHAAKGGAVGRRQLRGKKQPIGIVDEVVHYCVANMPGAVPRTSTFALNNATLPFVSIPSEEQRARVLARETMTAADLERIL